METNSLIAREQRLSRQGRSSPKFCIACDPDRVGKGGHGNVTGVRHLWRRGPPTQPLLSFLPKSRNLSLVKLDPCFISAFALTLYGCSPPSFSPLDVDCGADLTCEPSAS